MNIILSSDSEVVENTVTIRGEHSTTTYRLPRKRPRVTVERVGRATSRLVIGSFDRVSVTVTGPSTTIERLRESVL